jgi:transposase
MSFVPAPHPSEFRQRAVDLARSGVKPIAVIAKELSISESCLRNWLAQDDADEGRSNSSRLTSDEKRELAELRKKARRLEVENEILKCAAAYFARENVLPK